MKQLPREVIAYKKTKIFNEGNIPKALLNDHKTLGYGELLIFSKVS